MSKDVAIVPRSLPFGNYHLLERLAVGGMAEVYLAKSAGVGGPDRLVALKRILPTIAEDDEFIAMFIDEAKIAGQLSHENIAQIYDLGKINSSYFIAMEYVSGHDLRALWARARDTPEGMPLPMVCSIVRRICAGLDYAHRRRDNRGRPLGIIHRDVSPQNILLSYDGELKIIDFGIAKAANRMVRTQTGILKGKFAYMAPEQARGEPTDHRADVFAIGVILYELATGERAFQADTDFALLEKVRKVDVVAPRKIRKEIPPELERIIYRALARDAEDRYGWASELEEELARFMKRQGYRGSKSKVGSYLRANFEEEYEEEQRRLKVYRAFDVSGGTDTKSEAPLAAPPPTKADDDTRIHDSRERRKSKRKGVSLADDASSMAEESVPGPMSSGKAKSKSVAALGKGAADAPQDHFAKASGTHDAFDVEDATHLYMEEGGSAAFGEPTMVDPHFGERVRESSLLEETSLNSEVPSFSSVAAPESKSELESAAYGRALAAGATLVDPAASDEGDAARPPLRPRRHHDENLFSQQRTDAEVRHISVDAPSAPPPRKVAMGVIVLTLLVGAAVGVAVGAVAFGSASGGAPGFVLATDPAGVSVSLDGKEVCTGTPCRVRLETPSTLNFELAGGMAERRVDPKTVKDGLLLLSLRAPPVELTLETEPAGASVVLDGRELSGKTPLKLPPLESGSRVSLSLKRDGYKAHDEVVVVPADASAPWRFKLNSRTTKWTLSVSPEDAVIQPTKGKWKQGKATVVVEDGESVAVRLARPGCDSQLLSLTATGSRETTKRVSLKCRRFNGSVSVSSRGRVWISIDGELLPGRRRALRNYRLRAGPHVVELRSRKGRVERSVVEVSKGQNSQVKSKLR